MTETPGINNDSRLGNVKDSTPASLSTNRMRALVQEAIANLKAQGISDWQILSAWSQLAYEQGNYAQADTLASAAYELGKPPA